MLQARDAPRLATHFCCAVVQILAHARNHLTCWPLPWPNWPALQDLEACYVCWDILWADGKPLAQLPLLERHRLLRQAVSPAPPEGQRCGGPEVSPVFPGRFVGLLLCRAKPGQRQAWCTQCTGPAEHVACDECILWT